MATVDIYLANAMGRERVLDRCLRGEGDGDFDVTVVDTAPYLGLLTLNALVAADYVLVPVTCEYLPILGLKLFGDMLRKIKSRVGARAEILGYVLTMYDRRERITLEVESLVRKSFGELVFPVLLWLGLFGRLAALGLSAVNAMAVIAYAHVLFADGFEAALGQHYLWGFMLLVLAVYGPGGLSFDRLVMPRIIDRLMSRG